MLRHVAEEDAVLLIIFIQPYRDDDLKGNGIESNFDGHSTRVKNVPKLRCKDYT